MAAFLESSRCGAGRFCDAAHRGFCFSQVRAAVTQIERLVDEREVRNDVAVHRVLEERPVLPRGIVRVQAVDATCARDIEGDQHLTAPALDPARAARARSGRRDRDAQLAGGRYWSPSMSR